MKKPELVATITEELQLHFEIPRLLRSVLAPIGIGEKVRVDIKKWYKKRSQSQNAYLWGVVYPTILQYITETTGQTFTADELHDRYKRKFIGYEECDILPGLFKTKSSTELDAKEFGDNFIEQICAEWADLGLYIPEPIKEVPF